MVWHDRGVKKSSIVTALLTAALFAVSAAAQALPTVPRINYTEFTLSNGLRVVLSVDHALPVVTESMIFNVGARDERPGQSGFAHLFEHLMFEGSKNAPKGVFDHVVEGHGGNDNASTHTDYTFYYENVPANVLPAIMWLDADRMASLDVTEQNMKNQIAVVEEEKRLRVDNAPYGPLMYVDIGQSAFANWQNAHPVIGSFKDLDAATLAEVQEFHREYYAPANCVLTIVGDIDPVKTKAMVEHYFGWIPNLSTIKPVNTKEPPPIAKTVSVKDAQAKLPAVAMAWQGPPRDSPDFYALTMLGQLLFDGDSSRLYQSLVKDNQVAIEVDGGLGFPDADFTDYRAPGLFTGVVFQKPNATADQIEKLVYQQIQEIEANGVSPAEMNRLKTKFSSEWLQSQQTTLDRATLLALATLFDGNPDAANSELPRFLAVTSEQMEQVARTYLTHARGTVVLDVPGAAAPSAPSPKPAAPSNGGGQ